MDGACTFLYFFFWKNLPIKRRHYIFATAIIQNTFHFFINLSWFIQILSMKFMTPLFFQAH